MIVVGVLLLFNLTLRGARLSRSTSGGRAIASATTRPLERRGRPRRPRHGGPAAPRHSRLATPGAAAAAAADGDRPKPDMPLAHLEPGAPQPDGLGRARHAAVGVAGCSRLASWAPAEPPRQWARAGIWRPRDPDAPGDELLAAEDTACPGRRRDWALPGVGAPRTRPSGDRQGARRSTTRATSGSSRRSCAASRSRPRSSGTNSGPVVTQYEVKPDVRVKLSRIEGLADDLAMALAARTIRIEAPIPGKDVVGIEIPNHASRGGRLPRALSRTPTWSTRPASSPSRWAATCRGKAYAVDLARMPHLLIAGATGSGKSVCVNALITSLLMRATPGRGAAGPGRPQARRAGALRRPAAPQDARHRRGRTRRAAALHWAVGQMEDRYKLLAAKAERNIAAYNASPRVSEDERLPYIVLVIDELADLMMREGRKVEDPIVKLAQKARAVGIHLVLATQRPSVNVVTGLIKANVPSRIAFAMASNVDSRTVLDQPGAEDLIGRGDMLYQPADLPRPVRLQGVFVSRRRGPRGHRPLARPGARARLRPGRRWRRRRRGGRGAAASSAGWPQMAEDELTPRAAELVMPTGKASTSMMQTKLKVGFNRASRLMDELERFGIVGPAGPAQPGRAAPGLRPRELAAQPRGRGRPGLLSGLGRGAGMHLQVILLRGRPHESGYPRPALTRRHAASSPRGIAQLRDRSRGPPRRMTARQQSRLGGRQDRGESRRRIDAEPRRAPGRHAARRAREEGRRPVSRRAGHEDPRQSPRGARGRRLQGAAGRGLHQGLPAQLRALPGPRPDELVLAQWRTAGRRESAERADRPSPPQPLDEPRAGLHLHAGASSWRPS